jgi:hypothetical protein
VGNGSKIRLNLISIVVVPEDGSEDLLSGIIGLQGGRDETFGFMRFDQCGHGLRGYLNYRDGSLGVLLLTTFK